MLLLVLLKLVLVLRIPFKWIHSGWVWCLGTRSTGVSFNGSGPKTFALTNGKDYGGIGQFACSLGEVISSYQVLDNPAEYAVNFLIQGPSNGESIYESIATGKQTVEYCSLLEKIVLHVFHLTEAWSYRCNKH